MGERIKSFIFQDASQPKYWSRENCLGGGWFENYSKASKRALSSAALGFGHIESRMLISTDL